MRLLPGQDIHINAFSGATITELESGITNGVIEKRGEVFYLTQRPSIDVFGDASLDISDARGRAIYYWESEPSLYIFNNDTIYKGNYGSVLSASPTAGTKKCKFFEVGNYLVLLDPENDQGFTITTADVVAEITDTDFPPKQTPAVGLAYGGAALDNYLFVLGENGIVYHCDSNDPTAWNALSFKEAEREPDGGEYLAKHHDNLAIFGVGTLEFAYDAANPTGSVLNIRQDISYNIGCSSGESVHEEGDRIFWVGTTYSGSLGVYLLENFQVRKISTSTLDSFLTQAIVRDGYTAVGSGLSGQGHVFYVLTIGNTPSDFSPSTSLVYDLTTGIWAIWDTDVSDLDKFSVIGWTKRQGDTERYGEGILTNGDLISINDNLVPNDSLLGAVYVTSGYVAAGYVSATTDAGTAIALTSRMGMIDLGTNLHKYPLSYTYAGDTTAASQTMTLKWSDENNSNFNAGRTLDTSKYQKITRCGRFRRRNHEITYSGSEQIRIEAIEAEIPVGDN